MILYSLNEVGENVVLWSIGGEGESRFVSTTGDDVCMTGTSDGVIGNIGASTVEKGSVITGSYVF